ncbi:epithelial discoidin domain-containing receptor 1 isoform X1 [Syngnathus acus]|uniref:epithelial discoidin domain-containing receptor 1 isoform X1 n=1 Tax=Syngnathus acus TaxID=161584 RepID=UPI0018860E2C|nr:epithelial discoidin domain-containing receptor 1 isoform X1 [Syngnathus acus]XP_037130791.1 epithelial discoidin domain-containing receptor 1 isoform X1 [Syngnathus acus]XP_037130792.1 epithelial discoidin domain-containing receptor 1 isoform X1 [Syngnathus acus]
MRTAAVMARPAGQLTPCAEVTRLLVLALVLAPVSSAEEHEWHFNAAAQCRYALGMEDGSILDTDISASSSWSDSTEAKHARLSSGEGDGAWCPAGAVFPDGSEYLQVDLRKLHFLALVGTQGRHADGHGQEFARSYRLRYSRDGVKWITWKDRWGQEVVSGNDNTYDVVLKDLGPPIVARMVRFYPLADRVMSVCLRVELYGCVWADGLKAYTAPVGHVMNLSGSPVYLNDSTYDGSAEQGVQFGGLGQLCDGVLGGDDFTESKELRVWPGYDYLGWNRDVLAKPAVDIEFHFEKPRLLRVMQVHSNNRHTQGVRVFNKVECSFKGGLLQPWSSPVLTLSVPLDDLKDPSSRTLSLPLDGRLAHILRCSFFFTDRWMLLSEITFLSDTFEKDENQMNDRKTPTTSSSPFVNHTSASSALSRRGATAASLPPPTTTSTLMTDTTTNWTLSGSELAAVSPRAGLPVAKDDSGDAAVLIGCLVGIILLLLAVIAGILWRQYWKKLLGKAQSGLSGDELRVHLSVPSDNVVINNTHSYSSRYQRIHTFPDDPERDAESEYQEPSALLRLRDHCNSTALLLHNPACYLLLSDHREGSRPSTCRAQEKSLNVPHGCGSESSPDKGFPPVRDEPPPYPGSLPYPASPPLPASVPHYAEADIVSLQGVSGNNTYAVPALASSGPGADAGPLPELHRQCLVFKEKLGEGQFGEVHLCEIENPQDLPNLEFPFNVRKGRPLLVAVKILRPDASKNARNDFLKEVKILSRLKDPNIIRLLGVCVSSDPLCMVTEYMESGDLNQYLSHRVLLDKSGPLHTMPTIGYPALISMAGQIASGMKFLSSLNFVHRDLATRNCLVGGERGNSSADDPSGERHIKIADFGMSRNLYAGDYYRIQGRAVLPIRWMAWECILMGKFTTASDVWAFGVTLWEMLSVCQEQPYSNLTDEQVIDNAGEFFRYQGKQVYLGKPAVCPQGLYELMLGCWNRDCKLRPSFGHIHAFLEEDAMNMV